MLWARSGALPELFDGSRTHTDDRMQWRAWPASMGTMTRVVDFIMKLLARKKIIVPLSCPLNSDRLNASCIVVRSMSFAMIYIYQCGSWSISQNGSFEIRASAQGIAKQPELGRSSYPSK